MEFRSEELQEYSRALEERVCSICRGLGYGGVCTIGRYGKCPIEFHLPRLIEAVLSTPRSKNIKDYVPKIREMVCSTCENQDQLGACSSRDLAYCGINCFLLVIVETIEEVYDRLRGSAPEEKAPRTVAPT